VQLTWSFLIIQFFSRMASSQTFNEFKTLILERIEYLVRMQEADQVLIKSIATSQALFFRQLRVSGGMAPIGGAMPIRKHNEEAMSNPFLNLDSLFNAARHGELINGQKRQAILLRQLCCDPYAGLDALKLQFFNSRLDITEANFSLWWDFHYQAILDRFRDRRASLIRFIKDKVGEELGVGKVPPEKGDLQLTRRWKQRVSTVWAEAKAAAADEGFMYPVFVTNLLLNYVKKNDPYMEKAYKGGFVDETCPPSDWWNNLVILEAFALNVLAVCFGEEICKRNLPCDEETIGGRSLQRGIATVIHQRKLFQVEETNVEVENDDDLEPSQ
jgi:hypothetical protein